MSPRNTTPLIPKPTLEDSGQQLSALISAELAGPNPALDPVTIDVKGPGLPALIDQLRAAGCTVTRANDYLERTAVANLELPPPPASVLDLPTEDWTRHLRDWAAIVAGQNHAGARLQDMRRQLDQEMAASMAAEAEDYLDVLRGPFTRAAAHARLVRDLGIGPEATAETVMAKGGRASEAWISFRGLGSSTPVRTLAVVAQLRAQLAELTGIGEGPDADHAVGITWPYTPDALTVQKRGEHPATKWLAAAHALDLVPLSELREIDIMAAQGHDTAALLDQARAQRAGRAATATGTDQTGAPAPVSA